MNRKKNERLYALKNKLDNYNEIIIEGEFISFNLRYLDETQKCGYAFASLSEKDKNDIFDTMKKLSDQPREHWLQERVGGGGLRMLSIYGDFPRNTEFELPSYIPENVKWARFRFGNRKRLVGFFIEDEYAEEHALSKEVFYLVFIDLDHKFYVLEEK